MAPALPSLIADALLKPTDSAQGYAALVVAFKASLSAACCNGA